MNVEPSPSTANASPRRHRIVSAAIATIAMIPIAACSSGDSDELRVAGTPEQSLATATPPATEAPSSLGSTPATSGRTPGTSTVDGVRLTYTVPAGWENAGWAVVKPNAGPLFGVVLVSVANIFVDPCRWVAFDPPVGPSVDELASAWANVRGLDTTAPIDITVDGFHGKQIEFTVPDYDFGECVQDRYGIFKEPGLPGPGPNYWAQGPNQHHQLWIVDVDRTRIVISASDFPHTSQQDRADLDALLASIRIPHRTR